METPNRHDSAERLIARVAAGDQRAFAGLYDVLAPLVFGVARRVIRDPAQAEEVTQEVFIEVWRSAAMFDPERASVRTWAATIAHRRSVDRVRSEQSERDRRTQLATRDVDPSPAVGDVIIERADQRTAAEALSKLSGVQREALVLAYYEGLTQQEIAERLDVPLGTVKTRVRDGLERLRQRMGVNR